MKNQYLSFKLLATEYSEGADIEGDRQAHDVQIYARCGRV
jgi:hypothetical protein